MNRETFALSPKELQRVAVISSCVKRDLACARAAELLDLTPRHVQRLKLRFRQGGEAAMAHASRRRPSPRRLPDRVRARILHLARTRYAGFNDHYLGEKLSDVEGLSLGRETLRCLACRTAFRHDDLTDARPCCLYSSNNFPASQIF